jgi:hypothetical protein
MRLRLPGRRQPHRSILGPHQTPPPQPIRRRKLNRALHTIVNWRMLHAHQPTHCYLTRRRGEQKTDGEIRRCFKRYTARRLFRLMETAAST